MTPEELTPLLDPEATRGGCVVELWRPSPQLNRTVMLGRLTRFRADPARPGETLVDVEWLEKGIAAYDFGRTLSFSPQAIMRAYPAPKKPA